MWFVMNNIDSHSIKGVLRMHSMDWKSPLIVLIYGWLAYS